MSSLREIDRQVDSSDLPWVEQADGVWFKPLRLTPETGTWTSLLRVSAGGMVSRHRHLGPVQAWVLQGSWRYLEHPWVAGPGSFVYEPAGDVHTLVVEPGEEMVTMFVVQGAIEYLDADGNIAVVDSAQRKLDLYLEHCRAHGLEPADVVY